MPADLSVLLAKLNSLSDDFAVTETFDGHDDKRVHKPPAVQIHKCTLKEVSDRESQAILHEIKKLGIAKQNMLDWLKWLDNAINGRSPTYPVDYKMLQGIYSDDRRGLVGLVYKIPFDFDLVPHFDLVHEKYFPNASHNKFSYCTQYTTFSNDSRDVHCRVTIYDNVRNVLNEMSVWKIRFRQALHSTQHVTYDSLYKKTKESAESWMSIASQRIGTQALAYSRARQLSTHRNAFRETQRRV
jgi:hypothetical protein